MSQPATPFTMSLLRRLLPLFAFAALTLLASCETLDRGSPKPPTEKLSSMPHNMPAPWEGQAGMPGMMGGGY